MSVNFSGQQPNNFPTNTRTVLDANYIVSTALPNAANTVNTNALNLQVATPYPTTETINVGIITTLATGANTKNINVVLQHTGALANGAIDTSNYVNIPTLGAPIAVIAGNATKFPATTVPIVKLPPGTLQYVRAQATGEANGGDASDGTITLELQF